MISAEVAKVYKFYCLLALERRQNHLPNVPLF